MHTKKVNCFSCKFITIYTFPVTHIVPSCTCLYGQFKVYFYHSPMYVYLSCRNTWSINILHTYIQLFYFSSFHSFFYTFTSNTFSISLYIFICIFVCLDMFNKQYNTISLVIRVAKMADGKMSAKSQRVSYEAVSNTDNKFYINSPPPPKKNNYEKHNKYKVQGSC